MLLREAIDCLNIGEVVVHSSNPAITYAGDGGLIIVSGRVILTRDEFADAISAEQYAHGWRLANENS